MKSLVLLRTIILLSFVSVSNYSASGQKKFQVGWYLSKGLGGSVLHREAFRTDSEKSHEVKPGYAYSWAGGIQLSNPEKPSFFSFSVGYRTKSNGVSGLVDIDKTVSSKTSYARYNFVSIVPSWNRYVGKWRDADFFVGLGIETSVLINHSMKLRYQDTKARVRYRARQIVSKYFDTLSTSLVLSGGLSMNRGLLGKGDQSRLKLDFIFDRSFLGLKHWPVNQYFTSVVVYELVF